MSAFIDDLYYGRIFPMERRTAYSDKNRLTISSIETEKQYFIRNMSADDCQRFERLDKLYAESCDIEQLSAFACGFKLGAEFMKSVYSE